MRDKTKGIVTLVSPLVVIAVGFTISVIVSRLIGEWAFVPMIAVYWAITLAFSLFIGKIDLKRLFARPSGSIIWPILALLVGLIPLPIFLLNLKVLHPVGLVLALIAFALINPFFEEIFWRGFLLEALPFGRKWIRAAYSIAFYILLHPLTLGIFSPANRNYMTLISLAVMGTVWSAVSYKSKSLWWCVASHLLVDFFNLSVFAILNLYTPG